MRSLLLLLVCLGASAQTPVINGGGSSATSGARSCEIHIWGSGASSALQATDDEPASCYNDATKVFTITSVRCLADNGSTTTTVTPILTGGSATSILTGALTCGNGTFAAGTLSGTPAIAAAGTVDANVTVAGTAKSIRLIISGTY